MNDALIDVDIAARVAEAEGIVSLVLAAPAGAPALPAFEPGAHIDVELPGGAAAKHLRQYSLVDLPSLDARRYRIAVQREATSRGGSAWLVEQAAVGTRLRISPPRNHFALAAGAAPALLLAGGIGLTPLLCMARGLLLEARPFALHACFRTRARAAFVDEMSAALPASSWQLHLDDGAPPQRFDARAVLAAAAPATHAYVCGPAGFMDHVLGTARTLGWPEERLHREYFSAAPIDHSADGPFELQLGRGGRVVRVGADESAAEALLAAGVDVQLSCEQGVCGTCITRVLEGVPDHRDLYFSDAERAANDQFTPCCSRAKTPRLVLDMPG